MVIPPQLISSLQAAKRPLFIWGAGIRPHADQAHALARSLGIPVACTWGAIDLLNHDDPLMCGGFGTHGTRAANFAVQNSDFIISIGSRLDTKATGNPEGFARCAKLVMVDVDRAEIDKFRALKRPVDFPICADAGEFIEEMLAQRDYITMSEAIRRNHWLENISCWKERYASPAVPWSGLNPYQLMLEIGKYTTKDDILCTDTGFALGWTMQAFPFKGERFLHAFNMTPMGWGLPAAIGATLATGLRTILISGDGSFLMSVNELATLARHNLPIKIILLDNQGHGMCRQTQRQWLGSEYPATSVDGGLGFPKWNEIPSAFRIRNQPSLKALFEECASPGFLRIEVPQEAHLIPQAKYGQPIEDADPQLPWEELCEQMLVPPLPRS